jgi:PAS domain S-box-containing protein
MATVSSKVWRSCLFALIITLVPIGIVFAFPLLRERGAFMLLLGAVAASTWYGGWRAGAVRTALAAVYAAFDVLRLYQARDIGDDVIRLGLFLFVASLIALLYVSRAPAHASLRRSEDRLKLALEAAGMVVWEHDMTTRSGWCSEGFAEVFGSQPVRFSSTYEGYLSYIHPQDRDFVERAITRTIDNGMDYEIEHRIVKPDKSVRWVSTRGRIICAQSGRVERMTGVVWDVTDRKAQRGELERPPLSSSSSSRAVEELTR